MVAMSILCCATLSAQQDAREWIDALNRGLGTRYGVHIEVLTDDSAEPLTGYYMVEDDSYYLTLGVMEVYSDAALRYEINNERKEVTEDRVNLDSVDLLTNPTRAFRFVDAEFMSSVVESGTAGATLRLVPRDETYGISDITVVLQRSGDRVLPTTISYDYDGYMVRIELLVSDVEGVELPSWEERKEGYRAYDMVSFL